MIKSKLKFSGKLHVCADTGSSTLSPNIFPRALRKSTRICVALAASLLTGVSRISFYLNFSQDSKFLLMLYANRDCQNYIRYKVRL